MQNRSRRLMSALSALFFLVFFATTCYAHHPTQPITLKLAGAKMSGVTFSHSVHVDKLKQDCKICHHKDPEKPTKCTTCHDVKVVKDGAPVAKDAFHQNCQGCHKKEAEKGVKAPIKCNECHKN